MTGTRRGAGATPQATAFEVAFLDAGPSSPWRPWSCWPSAGRSSCATTPWPSATRPASPPSSPGSRPCCWTRRTSWPRSALSVTVAPARRRLGLSRLVIQALKEAAARAGLGTLLAPVRPSGKSAYPLTPMERYVRWTRPDGAPFDPWLRTHWRLGGQVLGVFPASMEIIAEVAAWEAWTGLAFPETGEYVITGALVPVAIDRERDLGRYLEPNLWLRHRCGANLPT